MDIQKIEAALALAGSIALGLPAVLRSLEAFFAIIPGAQPDKALDSVRAFSEKLADIISKLYPSKPADAQAQAAQPQQPQK